MKYLKRRQPRPVPPYRGLASIYDHVMQHVDYVGWADYIESVFEKHRWHPARLLDLSCGTGTFVILLDGRGYRVAGADASADMLHVARGKAKRAGLDIPFFCRDLRQLGGLPKFEAVVCLYDSINYLMTLEDVAKALEEVESVLEPGGLFVFDICTETNSLTHFRDMTDRGRGDGFFYTRHSYYEHGIQFNRFEIQFSDSTEVLSEVHKQRIYSISDIRNTLNGSAFQVEGVYDGFGFSSPTDLTDRLHFVLRARGRSFVDRRSKDKRHRRDAEI